MTKYTVHQKAHRHGKSYIGDGMLPAVNDIMRKLKANGNDGPYVLVLGSRSMGMQFIAEVRTALGFDLSDGIEFMEPVKGTVDNPFHERECEQVRVLDLTVRWPASAGDCDVH